MKHLSGAPLQGRFLALPTNIRIDWKSLSGQQARALATQTLSAQSNIYQCLMLQQNQLNNLLLSSFQVSLIKVCVYPQPVFSSQKKICAKEQTLQLIIPPRQRRKTYHNMDICGLYYKPIMIVKDDSSIGNKLKLYLLTCQSRHLRLSHVYSTGHWCQCSKTFRRHNRLECQSLPAQSKLFKSDRCLQTNG